MIAQVFNQNPQFRKVNDILRKYNGNMRDAFYGTAKEMNVDPDQILNAFNQN